MVRVRDGEFVLSVTFGTHDLDAVVARAFRERRSSRVILDRPLDVVLGHSRGVTGEIGAFSADGCDRARWYA